MTWRLALTRAPLPLLALSAAWGVWQFQALFVPWFVAALSAAAFEAVYVALAVTETRDSRRASAISVAAVAVSVIYNTLSSLFAIRPALLVARPLWADVTLAVLHGAPLAIVAYAVADLLLHQGAPVAAVPSSTLPTALPQSVKPPPAPDGFVYVLRAENGTHKIGMARDVAVRVQDIASFVPFQVEVVLTFATGHMRRLERSLHQCFADRRLRGEWFALTESDLDALASIGTSIAPEEIDDIIDTLSALVNAPETLSIEPDMEVPEIIKLKDLEHLTFAQIGAHLGISRQAAWQRYKDAKRQEKSA